MFITCYGYWGGWLLCGRPVLVTGVRGRDYVGITRSSQVSQSVDAVYHKYSRVPQV